jgi:hypothetical protein
MAKGFGKFVSHELRSNFHAMRDLPRKDSYEVGIELRPKSSQDAGI